MMFWAAIGLYAAAVPEGQLEASDVLRSEQFYIDSLRLVTQEKMYSDSLDADFQKRRLFIHNLLLSWKIVRL